MLEKHEAFLGKEISKLRKAAKEKKSKKDKKGSSIRYTTSEASRERAGRHSW